VYFLHDNPKLILDDHTLSSIRQIVNGVEMSTERAVISSNCKTIVRLRLQDRFNVNGKQLELVLNDDDGNRLLRTGTTYVDGATASRRIATINAENADGTECTIGHVSVEFRRIDVPE